MSRRRFTTQCCVAFVVALSGCGLLGASPASAAACKVKLTKWVLCSGKNEVATAPVIGTNEGMNLKGKILGVAVEISCKEKGSFKESIWELSEFTVKFVFNKCEVVKPAGCTIKGKTIITEPLLGVLEKPGVPMEVQFKGLNKFAQITIEGCVIAGTYELTGQQKCEVEAFAVEAAAHVIECKLTGSKLKLAGAAAELSTKAEIELMGVAKYNVEQN